jgi:FxLD family lantipeptide
MAGNASSALALAEGSVAVFKDDFNLDVRIIADVDFDDGNCGCNTDDGCSSTCASACVSA